MRSSTSRHSGSGELQPFTEPESARVELIPGTGDVLRFVFSSGEKPDALKWNDEVLPRKSDGVRLR